MGLSTPKQYLVVKGHEIIDYSIMAMRNSTEIDSFFVVAESQESLEYIRSKYGVDVILGGKTRNHSFYNGLKYIEKNGGCDKVFVNEAARPMISVDVISNMFNLSKEVVCVYCAKPVTDSIEYANGEYANRANYRLVMSPEIYDFLTILKYFDPESETTFPGHTIPNELGKAIYTGYKNNIKITYLEDLLLFTNIYMCNNWPEYGNQIE